MVTKAQAAKAVEPEETPVAADVPDVCDGCAELRAEFEAFRDQVRNNAQGM